MDPLTILSLVSAAMALLKEGIPQVRELFDNGDITKEQQEKILAEYNSLKEKADGQFSGVEWEQSGRED